MAGSSTAGYELDRGQWPRMPENLCAFLVAALPRLQADPRFVGLAAGGSFIHGALDEQSDLDLVVAVRNRDHAAAVAEGEAIASSLGPLLVAFTGDHVGEPRLWICLYGPPPFHIDLKFVAADDFEARIEDPVLLWDRTGAVRTALASRPPSFPQPDLQWIEDRFWVWVHYTADKITRGELFEAIDSLGLMRSRVLGPLIQQAAGRSRPAGVRRIEQATPRAVPSLAATLAGHDTVECRTALAATVALYRQLRSQLGTAGLRRRQRAEDAAAAHAGIGG